MGSTNFSLQRTEVSKAYRKISKLTSNLKGRIFKIAIIGHVSMSV